MPDKQRREIRNCDERDPKKMLPVFRPWYPAPLGQCPNSYDPTVWECVRMWSDWKAGLKFAHEDISALPAFVKQGLTHCENAAQQYWDDERKASERKGSKQREEYERKLALSGGK